MQARMKNPALVLSGAMKALMDLAKATEQAGLSKITTDLVLLRASQTNGCSPWRRGARRRTSPRPSAPRWR
jgi:alkylhydroperoxidase family enzyme